LLLGSLRASAAAASSSKEASREIEAKVTLESSLERRLQAVLREALGSDDLIVIVNVALRSETAAPEEDEVMPGVPLKAQSRDESAAMALPMVSRLTATIMVDESLEAKDVDLISKVADGILGISKARGDSLAVEKIKFHKPRAQQDPLRYAAFAASALWLLLAVVAMVLLQRKFLGPLITNLGDISAAALLRERGGERSGAAEPEAAAETTTAARAVAAASPNGARAYHPFSFVDPGDLPRLVYILRRTNAAETATIIQYLPADLAAKALTELEPDARRAVVGALSRVTQLDAELVKPLEDTLRKRLDFLIGGEDKLVELLDVLPASMQEDLLASLRADVPETAKAVSRRLVFVEDLAALEPAEIKLLSRRVPAKVLAVLLKATPSLAGEILPKLAGGTREWLTQEIEFSQEPSMEVLESARRLVLAAVSQLVREGRIVLRKKVAVETAAVEKAAVEGA
jgi:flagellar motor switch protein FliG